MQVGRDVFRTKDHDVDEHEKGKKPLVTTARYLSAVFQEEGRDGDVDYTVRFGELIRVYKLKLNDEHSVVIAKADWFQARASSLDKYTRNVFVRTDLTMDLAEPFLSVRDDIHQVVLSEICWPETNTVTTGLPNNVPRVVVLDRKSNVLNWQNQLDED
jgi:hypothetical protein